MSQSNKAKPVQLTALQMTSGPDPEKICSRSPSYWRNYRPSGRS